MLVQFNCLVPSYSLQRTRCPPPAHSQHSASDLGRLPWQCNACAESCHIVHTVQCQWTLIMSYTYPVPSFANGTCCWVEVLVPGSPAGSLVFVPGYWHLWWSCCYVLQHQLCCLLMAPYLEHCYPAPGIPLIKMNWLMDPSLMILLKYFHTITSHNFTKS